MFAILLMLIFIDFGMNDATYTNQALDVACESISGERDTVSGDCTIPVRAD